MTDHAQIYTESIWSAFQDKVGTRRMMGPVEFQLVRGWLEAKIPLRVVLRAFKDTEGRGKSLLYYEDPVRQAYAHWRASVIN